MSKPTRPIMGGWPLMIPPNPPIKPLEEFQHYVCPSCLKSNKDIIGKSDYLEYVVEIRALSKTGFVRDYYNMPQEQFELVLKEMEPYGWYARITNIKMSRYSTSASLHYDISPTPFESPKPNKFIQKIKEFFATYFCDP